MKPERWVFGGLGLFYLVVTPVYWFTAHEVAGTWVLGPVSYTHLTLPTIYSV